MPTSVNRPSSHVELVVLKKTISATVFNEWLQTAMSSNVWQVAAALDRMTQQIFSIWETAYMINFRAYIYLSLVL